MAQWGRNDQSVTASGVTTKETSNGAPIGTYALVKAGGGNSSVRVDGANAHFGNTSAGSRANVDVAMFGNTTMSAFIPGKAVGVFGVSANEMSNTNGGIALTYVTSGGTGYGADAAVTLTLANGTTNTTAVNSSVSTSGATRGRVTGLNINIAGTTYVTNPSVAIAAPAAINITANSSGFSNTNNVLVVSSANSRFQVGDRLYYTVPTGNTAIAPLTGNAFYYVSFANSSTLAVSATSGGSNIDITDARVTNPGETHTIKGDTATGYVTVGGTHGRAPAHAGWVLRTEGSGGRAGRVQYETLVAMGSLGAQTAPYGKAATTADAENVQFPGT